MDVEQPTEDVEEAPDPHAFSSYIITHLPEAAKSVPLAGKILSSISRGEKRSLGDDMLHLNEVYKTKVNIKGQENIPSEGGFIYAVSHTSATKGFPGWRDENANPLWILAGMTEAHRNARGENTEFRIIAIDPSSINKLAGPLVRNTINTYNGFPINKYNPREAVQALEAPKQALAQGDVIVISPEGEENTQAISAKRGISRLAAGGQPVVPVAFVEQETDDGFTHTVKFGKPVVFESTDSKSSPTPAENRIKEIEFADKIGQAIAELLPEAQRGVYK